MDPKEDATVAGLLNKLSNAWNVQDFEVQRFQVDAREEVRLRAGGACWVVVPV